MRILLNIHYLELGGAEMSLVGLLNALDPAKCEVDLLVNDPRGELMPYVPDWVRVVHSPAPYRYVERGMVDALKHGQIPVVAARLLAKWRYGRYCAKEQPTDGSAIFSYIDRCVTPVLPSMHHLGEYDLAVCFMGMQGVVLDKVNARRKVAWIHTDYTAIDVNRELDLPRWERFDHIATISDEAGRQFLERFPELAPKIVKIENILPVDMIRRRSQELKVEKRAGINLLTIGRYCAAKRLDKIPEICSQLVVSGLDVHWDIIGYGVDDSYIRRAISACGMEGRVRLLGKKENPYPYIAACDWYVQPSIYEGKSITVREAQALGRPVIITRYPTSASQLVDGFDGIIVPLEPQACAQAMAQVLKDADLKARIEKNIASSDYSLRQEADKLYSL